MTALGIAVAESTGRDLSILEDVSGRTSKRLHDAALLVEVASDALRMGAEVHYIGSDERLGDIRSVVEIGGRCLKMEDWRMPPLDQIGRRYTEAFPEIMGDSQLLTEAFGYVCLPARLTERMLHRPRERPMLVLIDGVPSCSTDVCMALRGISAFCKRTGATLAIFP